jgi:acyl carrier protein
MNEELVSIIKDMSNPDGAVTETMLLREDLGFDSMKMIMFLNQACKSLSISIMDLDPHAVSELKTVDSLISYLDGIKN